MQLSQGTCSSGHIHTPPVVERGGGVVVGNVSTMKKQSSFYYNKLDYNIIISGFCSVTYLSNF